MQHEMMRHPAPAQSSENVGDVLASIRRLIAQDESGSQIPNQLLNALPPAPQVPAQEDQQPAAASPLKLDSSDLIAPEAEISDATSTETGPTPVELRLHLTPEPEETKDVGTDTFLGGSPWRDVIAGIGDDTEDDQMAMPAPTPIIETAPETGDTTTQTPIITDTTTTAHMEETMLHANASVTPINPAIEAQAKLDEILPETGEPHLFARQDKDAQKGTHLRGMIREAIRQELQGEIGNRLSRNLQQMIRHEIELTLRQMCEQE